MIGLFPRWESKATDALSIRWHPVMMDIEENPGNGS
jgi:hypothetical protein